MRTPVVLVTGVDPAAMAAAMMGCLVELPGAVAVRHHIDVDRQVLTRVVSDLTGEVERHEIDLEHACVSCAIREDVVPTLARLAADGRWAAVVAHLPLGAEARQVCTVLSWEPKLARRVQVASVVAALAADTATRLVDDLLGPDLLAERGCQTGEDDLRGVGETACALVEYADTVVLLGDRPGGEDEADGVDLVRALARPDADVVDGVAGLTTSVLLGRHRHRRTEGWAAAVRDGEVPLPTGRRVWQLDLRSPSAFHPERLLDDLESLGGGRHRARGCFWLPTRPGRSLAWDGAGGHLSLGHGEPWGRRTPFTRLVLTGVGSPPIGLVAAFDALLLREAPSSAGRWKRFEDGFEPWLGPIEGVA